MMLQRVCIIIIKMKTPGRTLFEYKQSITIYDIGGARKVRT